jgi:hypothetical protein
MDDDLVHVHGGSALLDALAAAGVPGQRLEWSEVLCDGPMPLGLAGAEWYDVRAAFLTEGLGVDGARDRLEGQDRALDDAIDDDRELVIWAGPELFCQMILVRLIERLARRASVWIVDPGDLPGQPGCSLAHLDAAALHEALAARRPVTAAVADLASGAWSALTWRSPRMVEAILDECDELPHLAEALRRHLEELPSATTGLARSERAILDAIAGGAATGGEVFAAVQLTESRPWLTDGLLALGLRRLGAGADPLIESDVALVPGAWDPAGALRLRPGATEVLTGRDFWRGPVR